MSRRFQIWLPLGVLLLSLSAGISGQVRPAYLRSGRVEIEKPGRRVAGAWRTAPETKYWVQILAGSDRKRVMKERDKLIGTVGVPVRVVEGEGLYKLRVGGLGDLQEARLLRARLVARGYDGAWIVEVRE